MRKKTETRLEKTNLLVNMVALLVVLCLALLLVLCRALLRVLRVALLRVLSLALLDGGVDTVLLVLSVAVGLAVLLPHDMAVVLVLFVLFILLEQLIKTLK